MYKPLLFIIFITGIGVSITEGLGVALMFPLVQVVSGVGSVEAVQFPFGHIVSFFSGMTFGMRLRMVALFLVLVTALRGGLLYLKNLCSIRFRLIVSKHFQMECFNQLMRVGMGYFNVQKRGDLHTIVNVHTNCIGMSIARFADFIHMPFTVIVLLIILFCLSWQVALVSIFLAGVLMISMKNLIKRIDYTSRKLGSVTKNTGNKLFEAITGMKVVRLFNREDDTRLNFERAVDNYNTTISQIGELKGMVQPITQFTGSICVAIIIVAASFMLIGSRNTGLDVLLIFLVAFSRIISPVMTINETRTSFIGDLPYYREVFSFLKTEDKKFVKNGQERFTGLIEGIEFHDVEFRYNTQDPVVLKKVSFYISKGAKIGVVGPSGAGKSTITELLLRFYDPQTGHILIDGVDLRTLNINSWRKHIGVVSQDIFLFNDTVRANIAYAKPEATQEEIETAAQKAHAHEFIKELPNGYNTLLGDRGVLLSGGQRQRIAIARAIIINPEILVLDEATSSLDTESEKVVQRALDEIGQSRTVITIAHRLSTIFDSDKIIVINNGQIVEAGTHEELLSRQGLYCNLVKLQQLESKINKQEQQLENHIQRKQMKDKEDMYVSL